MAARRLASARLAPLRPDELLLFVGQDVRSVAEYATAVAGGGAPAGVTSYTGIRDADAESLRGLWDPVDYGAGLVHADALLSAYPAAALALGLDLVGALDGIVAGRRDAIIDKLGDFITHSARPVYLRIGYEL